MPCVSGTARCFTWTADVGVSTLVSECALSDQKKRMVRIGGILLGLDDWEWSCSLQTNGVPTIQKESLVFCFLACAFLESF